jgi:5'(3')-deoxyribonucleotidase
MARHFVLGVDLDGVCGDYTEAFRQVVMAETGKQAVDLPDQRSWSFAEWGLDDAEFERLHRAAVVEHRFFRAMPVMDGCVDALWRLSDAGVWIRIISHRLYVNWGHVAAAGDTAAWLDDARIPYRDLCFIGAKSEIDATCYVEDGPHNIEALQAKGGDVIIFDQPYNRHCDGGRAADWHEVELAVLDRLAAFHGAVQEQLPGIDPGADRLDRHKRA